MTISVNQMNGECKASPSLGCGSDCNQVAQQQELAALDGQAYMPPLRKAALQVHHISESSLQHNADVEAAINISPVLTEYGLSMP